MAYEKFSISDRASTTLAGAISESTTSIVVNDGSAFPTGKQIITLVEYETPGDETTAVVKREDILCSSRSGDTFVVASGGRGYDGGTAQTFASGDTALLTIHTRIIEDIQDEVTRLESDKLDNAGELRTGLSANRIIYTNGSGTETELPLGASGTFLGGNGTENAPSWEEIPGQSSLTLWETIAAGEAVRMGQSTHFEDTGKLYKTDANVATKTECIGFLIAGGDADESRGVASSGLISGLTGLSANTEYYLSDTPGAISATPGTIRVPIGVSVGTDSLFLYPKARENLSDTTDSVVLDVLSNRGSGTQSVSHALWRIPKKITFSLWWDETSGDRTGWSQGVYLTAGDSNKCAYWGYVSGSWNGGGTSTSYCIRFTNDESTDGYLTGAVTAVSAANFTITWAENNNASAVWMRLLIVIE